MTVFRIPGTALMKVGPDRTATFIECQLRSFTSIFFLVFRISFDC